jgi:hypothetical protein
MKLVFKILFLFILLNSSFDVFAANNTASTGDWDEPGTWSSGVPGDPTCFDTLFIPVGVTVTITTQEDLTACPGMYVDVQGELHFQSGKKIEFPCGSAVYINPGPPAGELTGGGGGGSSNWIKICDIEVWSAGDGDLTGPDILCIGCALPIELLSFTATLSNSQRQVELEWATASESNNDYFTVERSADGINWEFVKETEGAGNSVALLTYDEIDEDPIMGVSYYRLKQTDFDGEFSYSPIVSVELLAENELTVYPNPVDQGTSVNVNYLVINYPEGFNGESDLIIYSVEGKVVYQTVINVTETHQTFIKIDEGFAPGFYAIHTKFANTKFLVK